MYQERKDEPEFWAWMGKRGFSATYYGKCTADFFSFGLLGGSSTYLSQCKQLYFREKDLEAEKQYKIDAVMKRRTSRAKKRREALELAKTEPFRYLFYTDNQIAQMEEDERFDEEWDKEELEELLAA